MQEGSPVVPFGASVSENPGQVTIQLLEPSPDLFLVHFDGDDDPTNPLVSL